MKGNRTSLKICLFLLIVLTISFCRISNIKAYYAINRTATVGFTTRGYSPITVSLDKTIYPSGSNNATVLLTVTNPNNYAVTYNLSFSNTTATYLVDGAAGSTYVVLANSSKTNTITISGATGTSITISVNSILPYSKTETKVVNFDNANPTATITTTNNVAASQTATLKCGDNVGVTAYYWGQTEPMNLSQISTVTSADLTALTGVNGLTKNVTSSGTYWLGCRDATGNFSKTSIQYSKITLNMSNGTVSPTNIVAKVGNSIALPTPTASVGYTAKGNWYTNSGLTSGAIAYGSSYTIAGTTNLYSGATANTYEVKYNNACDLVSGGSMSNSSHTYDTAKNLTANGYTCNATVTYDYHEATGGNSSTSGTATSTFLGWTVGGPNLYRIYNINTLTNMAINSDGTLTVAKDNTNGTSTSEALMFTSPNENVQTGTNYVYILDLKEKTTSGDSSINLYLATTNSGKISQINSKTLYFNGLFVGLNHVNVTSADSFTNASWMLRDGITIPAGKSATLRFRPILLEGTYSDKDLYYYNQGSVINLATSGIVNLYADWNEPTVTLPTPTKTGYTFNGWYTAATGGTKVGDGGATYRPSANITLHAQWTEKTATLTYNANNCGTAPSNVTMKYTTATTAASSMTMVSSNHTLTGWNTSANGSGTAYALGATVNGTNVVPSAITLYAQCTFSVTPTITRNDRDTFTVNATGATSYLISKTQTTQPTASASGWSTTTSQNVSKTASETWYVWVKDVGGRVSSTGSTISNYAITLTAGTGTTLTAKADSNDANGSEVTSTNKYVLSGTPVFPHGALVAGYNTLVVNKNGVAINNDSSNTISAATTFTTSATLNKVTLTLKRNGSACTNCNGYTIHISASDTSDTASFSATTTTDSTLTINGAMSANSTYYIWAGKDSKHKTTLVYSGVSFTGGSAATATINYYSVKMALTNTTMKFNGSTIASGSTVVALGTTTTRKIHTIVATPATGYGFSSWSSNKAASTIEDTTAASTTMNAGASTTLTAISTDNTSPSCTFGSWTESPINIGTSSVITLTCTDNIGVTTTSLSSSNFTLPSNDAYEISVIKKDESTATNTIFEITATGKPAAGTGTLTLKAGQVSDAGGNTNVAVTSPSLAINPDSIAPTLSISVPNGTTYETSKTATITIEDLGGAGLANTTYTIRYVWSTSSVTTCSSGAMPNTITITPSNGATTATGTITINNKTGAGSLYICSTSPITDRAQNSFAANQILSDYMYVDNAAPVFDNVNSVCIQKGLSVDTLNYYGNLTDAGSGIANVTYNTAINTSTIGTQTITYTATDNVGNQSTKVVTVRIFTKIKDNGVVTSGDGLYADSKINSRYIYRGTNPSNYLTYAGRTWRVLSIEPDGSYKLVLDGSYTNSIYNSTTDGIDDFTSTTVYTLLNTTFYSTLTDTSKILNYAFYTGPVYYQDADTTISDTLDRELEATTSMKVGLPNITDYLRSSIDSGCVDTTRWRHFNKSPYACKNSNWMYMNTTYYLLNIYNLYSLRARYQNSDGAVGVYLPDRTYAIRPVIYLDETTTFTGSGTSLDPYVVNTNCSSSGVSPATCTITSTPEGYTTIDQSNQSTWKTLTVNVTNNGANGITYSWDGTSYSSTNTRLVDLAGIYKAYIKDSFGRTNNCSITINSRTEYRKATCSAEYGAWGETTSYDQNCLNYETDTFYRRCTIISTASVCFSWNYDAPCYKKTIGRRPCTPVNCGAFGPWQTEEIEGSCSIKVDTRTTYGT